MQPLCTPLAAASEFSFAACLRLAIDYSEIAQRMTLVRLDRHGFTASVAPDTPVPPLGLPRAAYMLSGGETLCELRLVPRALTRTSGRSVELTMQPSRIDDDLSFWLALHARRHLYPDMPAGTSYADDRPGRSDRPVDSWHSPRQEIGSVASAEPAESVEFANSDACRLAAFKLATGNEALFFSEWLEFHFAEIAAYAVAVSPPSELLDIHRRRQDATVNVAFCYRYGGKTVQRSADALCARIAQQAERLFGICLRYELLAVQNDAAPPDRRLRSGAMASQSRRQSFSSK